MATTYSVKIHYGPCNSFHTVTYKPEKLAGLRDRLQIIGYRVELVPERFENHCMLEVCGHEVFRCNINNLMFNTPYYRDPVCKRAIDAVVDSHIKFLRARNQLFFLTVLQDRVFSIGQYELKDHWPQKYDLPPYAPSDQCRECCKILTSEIE